MGKLWQDVRYGLRVFVKSPGFAVVTVLALALGIGANSAIFSVVNGVLLKPLPYRNADRLVFLSEWSQQVPNMSVSYPNFSDWRDQTRTMDAMAAFRGNSFTLTGAGEPERLAAQEVSHNFFTALGEAPALGRNFLPEEDRPGGNRAAVISHGFWQRRFAGSTGVLGQPMMLNDESYTVVGVLPQNFEWQAPIDVWVPIGLRADRMQERGNHPGIYVVGQLKPGVTVEQARADMDDIVKRLAQQYPNEVSGFTIQSLQRRATDGLRAGLWVLMGAVVLVLLIACANVANLLLARAAARSKEMAIRAAMGAGRGRIIRQLLTESTMLSVVGGGLGLLLATWGLDGLLALMPAGVPQLLLTNIRLDTTVVAFTVVVSVLTGLLFGLAPALQISKTDLNESLKEGGRSGSGGTRHYVRNTLVVAEVAFSLFLLIGAGLLIKSFANLKDSDLGFNPERVLTARVALPEKRYTESQKIENFFNSLLARVRQLPGVEAAGLSVGIPMNGGIESSITVEGKEITDPKNTMVAVNLAVSPDYFKTMQIPLVEGRYFSEQDRSDSTFVAVIDEMMAARFFPNESPLGKRIRYGGANAPAGTPWMQIVGVVKHVKHYGPDEEGRVELYRPFTQLPFVPPPATQGGPPMTIPRSLILVVRTTGEPTAMTASVRNAVFEIDRDQPIAFVRTMDQIVEQTIGPQRFTTWLLAAFSATALLLAALGIYGVMAYSVTQRTHEIGVRMALGADRRDVLRMIVGQGMKLTAVGVGIGLVLAFIVTRLMSTLLYGVSAKDPAIYGGVAALLAGVALLSCLLPARRATRVDPMVALRYE